MRRFIRYFLNRETITYFFCGCLTVLVNYAVFWVLLQRFGNDYALLLNAIAFITSTFVAFLTNKVFVFQSRSFLPRVFFRELVMFFAARLFSFLFIEEMGLWLCTKYLHAADYSFFGISGVFIAKVFTTGVAVISNYIFSKFVIFRKKHRQHEAVEPEPVLGQESM